MPKFPTYKGANFGLSEVESYLESIASTGWQVYADDQPSSYVIVVDEEKQIKIWFFSDFKEWTVESWNEGMCLFGKGATSFQSFKGLIANAMKSLGQVLDSKPRTMRLNQQLPLSNRIGLVTLTKGAAVQDIFDPYFDGKAIVSLVNLIHLGLQLIPQVRILTTKKVKKPIPEQILSEFEVENGSKLNIRVCSSDKEHRRFLLLSSGETLILGCSLNSLNKNEAAHLENSQIDRNFFNEQWVQSNPL